MPVLGSSTRSRAGRPGSASPRGRVRLQAAAGDVGVGGAGEQPPVPLGGQHGADTTRSGSAVRTGSVAFDHSAVALET